MKKDAQLTIRLSAETKAAIKAAAGELDRKPNWLIVRILEQWLAQRQRRRRKSP